MSPSILDQLFVPSRARAHEVAPKLEALSRPLIWLHADTARAGQVLASFSETLLERAPGTSVLLTAPELADADSDVPGRVILPVLGGGADLTRTILERITPDAVLMATETLPFGMIRRFGRRGVPLLIAETASPRLASRWHHVPGVARNLLGHIDKVFVQTEASQSAWTEMGLPEASVIRCGQLSGIPVALGCNEAEREEQSNSFRHRTLWLAAGLPEREEAAVLAAHHEALRESHRLALILQPADPTRGCELRARCAEQFVTALRSDDDPVTPDTQVYIVDTEGERGLWYRLAVACYLGGTLSVEGATLSPMEAAGLGCAIVHGRMLGRFSESFDMLREARATRMIQSAEALGSAVCTALRPEQAADQAHRAWQVISAGAEATDTVISALLERCTGKGAR